jgi:hypothetical protein
MEQLDHLIPWMVLFASVEALRWWSNWRGRRLMRRRLEGRTSC